MVFTSSPITTNPDGAESPQPQPKFKSWSRSPESGAEVIQLTSGDSFHDNIYHEVSYADASSRWIMVRIINPKKIGGLTHPSEAFIKRGGFKNNLRVPWISEVWRVDLLDGSMTFVADQLMGFAGMAVSPDQHWFFCLQQTPKGDYQILKIHFQTLKQEVFPLEIDPSKMRPGTLGTASPDNRYFIVGIYKGNHRFGLLRIDLQNGQQVWILEEGADHMNMHPQIDPGRGLDLMVQQNRGTVLDSQGQFESYSNDDGATLFLIDLNGGNRRPLPVGKPFTWPIGGHQTWVGNSGSIIFTTSATNAADGTMENDDAEGRKQGTLRIWKPGEESRALVKGEIIGCPHTSKDGRFFSGSTHRPPARIYIGSVATGKIRLLHNSHAMHTIPHLGIAKPYFTPDNRWIIYNSDQGGTPHVYAVKIPEKFLELIDQDPV